MHPQRRDADKVRVGVILRRGVEGAERIIEKCVRRTGKQAAERHLPDQPAAVRIAVASQIYFRKSVARINVGDIVCIGLRRLRQEKRAHPRALRRDDVGAPVIADMQDFARQAACLAERGAVELSAPLQLPFGRGKEQLFVPVIPAPRQQRADGIFTEIHIGDQKNALPLRPREGEQRLPSFPGITKTQFRLLFLFLHTAHLVLRKAESLLHITVDFGKRHVFPAVHGTGGGAALIFRFEAHRPKSFRIPEDVFEVLPDKKEQVARFPERAADQCIEYIETYDLHVFRAQFIAQLFKLFVPFRGRFVKPELICAHLAERTFGEPLQEKTDRFFVGLHSRRPQISRPDAEIFFSESLQILFRFLRPADTFKILPDKAENVCYILYILSDAVRRQCIARGSCPVAQIKVTVIVAKRDFSRP